MENPPTQPAGLTIASVWAQVRAAGGRVTRRLRKALWGSRPATNPPVPGLPPGLSYEQLAESFISRWNEGRVKTFYHHLSGWKESGAYRLYLVFRKGETRTLIFKNATYDHGEIPALDGFPVRPGPAEFEVYAHASGALANFLPEVYLARELEPGRQYQYLLEDIQTAYARADGFEDRLPVVEQMASLHQALAEVLSQAPGIHLPIYDRDFVEALRRYALDKLTQYAASNDRPFLAQVLQRWPEVDAAHQRADVYDLQSLQPIHGDLNFANAYIHTSQPARIKILDWEWAGMGLPLSDLAAILKGAPPDIEHAALEIYSASNPGFPNGTLRRSFYWCLLDRSLNDAAFLAAIEMSRRGKANFDVPKIIESSLKRVLYAVEQMK